MSLDFRKSVVKHEMKKKMMRKSRKNDRELTESLEI